MTTTVKTIEIEGYLSETEVSKGKTALWFNGIEIVTDYVVNDYSYTDEEIKNELVKAQEYLDAEVIKNDWVITPKAHISINEFPSSPQLTTAINHVKQFYPTLAIIIFSRGRWQYMDEDFNSFIFDDRIDQAILEAAADSITIQPAIFEVESGFQD